MWLKLQNPTKTQKTCNFLVLPSKLGLNLPLITLKLVANLNPKLASLWPLNFWTNWNAKHKVVFIRIEKYEGNPTISPKEALALSRTTLGRDLPRYRGGPLGRHLDRINSSAPFSYSGILTRFLLEFELRVNYNIVALEDIYKSSTHGSSNSKRSLRYGNFSEVAHVWQLLYSDDWYHF